MSVLFLGPPGSKIAQFLATQPEPLVSVDGRLDLATLQSLNPDFVVSHSYRFVVKPSLLQWLGSRIINLHISLLPWNRGADPNLWSVLENTPAGVSIHVMDEGLDTGPILVQKEAVFAEDETLRTSYDGLQDIILDLFMKNWNDLRRGVLPACPQPIGGSFHKTADKQPYLYLLGEKGWDTPLKDLRGKALTKKG